MNVGRQDPDIGRLPPTLSRGSCWRQSVQMNVGADYHRSADREIVGHLVVAYEAILRPADHPSTFRTGLAV
jgi:hypothetical protein